jgi:hypothetical protein
MPSLRLPTFGIVVTAGLLALAAAPAGAVTGFPQPTLVSAVPTGATPNVNNGTVLALAQVGSRVIVGGSFTSVSPPGVTGGKQALTRTYVFAFDPTTGQVDPGFAPVLDGMVEGLTPGPSPDTVYVAGYFGTVNHVADKGIALLSTVTGAPVAGFAPNVAGGAVWSVVPSGGHLLLGGTFTKIGGVAHSGIGSINPTTGAVDPYLSIQLTGHHNYTGGTGSNAAVGARRMDLGAGGTRLVVVGNFKNADGALHDQIVLVDLGAGSAVVDPGWNTAAFSATCASSAYDTYVRDVAFSPDGTYFVVATTGGGGPSAKNTDGTRSSCDSASRYEANGSGTDVRPTWIDYTGNDSFESVTTTGTAVYVGGHQRWINNANASDSAGTGAVPRPGLAALDPASGIPLSWNPGRNPRGAGAYALLATSTALYVGSDTTYIGNKTYYRGRLAGFALAGGETLPSTATGTIPGTVYEAGPGQHPATTLSARTFDGSHAGALTTVDSTTDWSQVRGAFVVGPWLYYGWSDGQLYRRTFDGSTLGPASLVDPYDDPYWDNVQTGSGQSYQGLAPSLYGNEMQGVTGMFYSAGRLWYSRSGQKRLFWRWFSPESGIVGSTETTGGGTVSFSSVQGMFLSGSTLYYVAASNGALHAVDFAGGAPSTGTDHVVSGPPVDGTDWRAQGLFLVP